MFSPDLFAVKSFQFDKLGVQVPLKRCLILSKYWMGLIIGSPLYKTCWSCGQ